MDSHFIDLQVPVQCIDQGGDMPEVSGQTAIRVQDGDPRAISGIFKAQAALYAKLFDIGVGN
jgi:hypothetical protein